MIGGDENVNDQNSNDGEEDVGAGAGARDEFINLYRCVLATLFFMFGTRDTTVVQRGMRMLMVRALKAMWAINRGEAAQRD